MIVPDSFPTLPSERERGRSSTLADLFILLWQVIRLVRGPLLFYPLDYAFVDLCAIFDPADMGAAEDPETTVGLVDLVVGVPAVSGCAIFVDLHTARARLVQHPA